MHLGEIVAELEASPAYADMMIIITSDENGGLWDHVTPPRRDKWGPGTRIPLIVVGPTVKRGYVDHTPYDFGSILRTIECAPASSRWPSQTPTPTRCATCCGSGRGHARARRRRVASRLRLSTRTEKPIAA